MGLSASKMLYRLLQKDPGGNYKDLLYEINATVDQVVDYRPWKWLEKSYRFVLTAPYSTGTVTVTNGSNAVTGASTVWTSGMTGRKFRTQNSGVEYTFTYVSATSGTLDRVYSGDSDSLLTYTIYEDTYDLPSDYHSYIQLQNLDTLGILSEMNRNDFTEGLTLYSATEPRTAQYFAVWGRDATTDVTQIVIGYQPVTAHSLELLYWYRPTQLTTMQSEPDLPSWLHETVYAHVLYKYARTSERLSGVAQVFNKDFNALLQMAATADARQSHTSGRNKRRLFI